MVVDPKMPNAIGDLAAFTFSFTPPTTAPTQVVPLAQVQVLVVKPDGTEVNDSAGVSAGAAANQFKYMATSRINQAGLWTWRVNANSGLVDSDERSVWIPPSAFVQPLP